MKVEFTAKLWVWPGDKASWRFLTVPKDISYMIHSKTPKKRGFGSVRVRVKTGKTGWDTSIFPDSKSGTYLLPVKAKVRRAEGIDDGEAVFVRLETKP